jgi:hypothetical protein
MMTPRGVLLVVMLAVQVIQAAETLLAAARPRPVPGLPDDGVHLVDIARGGECCMLCVLCVHRVWLVCDLVWCTSRCILYACAGHGGIPGAPPRPSRPRSGACTDSGV